MFETYFIYGVVVLLLFIPLSIVLIRPALPPLLRAAALTLTLPLRLWRDGLTDEFGVSGEGAAHSRSDAAIVGLLWLNGLILVIGFSGAVRLDPSRNNLRNCDLVIFDFHALQAPRPVVPIKRRRQRA